MVVNSMSRNGPKSMFDRSCRQSKGKKASQEDVGVENSIEVQKKIAPSKTVNPASRGSCNRGASLTAWCHKRVHTNPVSPFERAPTPRSPPVRVSCNSPAANPKLAAPQGVYTSPPATATSSAISGSNPPGNRLKGV